MEVSANAKKQFQEQQSQPLKQKQSSNTVHGKTTAAAKKGIIEHYGAYHE